MQAKLRSLLACSSGIRSREPYLVHCSEHLVYLLHELGIETGIDLPALIDTAHRLEKILDRPLPGQVMKAGPHLALSPLDSARRVVGREPVRRCDLERRSRARRMHARRRLSSWIRGPMRPDSARLRAAWHHRCCLGAISK
jgi:hypothetical protein